MIIEDILEPERVLPELVGSTKEEVLAELAGLFAGAVPSLSADAIVETLGERERLNSTAIGDGVAIPHGRVPNIDQVLAGFARSPGGVDFDSVDGQPSRIFFVLLAPENAAALHLKALARISRMLRSESFRARLLTLDTKEGLFSAIVAEDEPS